MKDYTLTLSSENSCRIASLPQELKQQMVERGTWRAECPVGIDRLRLVSFLHCDFSGKTKQGEIVVLEAVAKRIALIFHKLYECRFPIAQSKTMEYFNGLDRPAMAANNTSAFNFRAIAGKTLLSVHSYGVAVDINPVQNPCVEPKVILDQEEIFVSVQPAEGQAYLNRTNIRPGMVEQSLDEAAGFSVVELFKQNGFHIWGGKWNDPVDWQHFQPSRAVAEWLAFMSPDDAELLFELYTERPTLLNNPKIREFDFRSVYEQDRMRFMNAVQNPDFWSFLPEEAFHHLTHC